MQICAFGTQHEIYNGTGGGEDCCEAIEDGQTEVPHLELIGEAGQLILIQSQGGISGIELTGGNALNTVSIIITMTAGTMFLVWMGELITERGIGNGISLLIFAGIIAG